MTETPPPPPPEAAPVAERRLRRSRTDRVIAGVCGGMGRHFGVDPVILRIAFVVLALVGGSGVLLYLLAWLLIPYADVDEEFGPAPAGDADEGRGAEIIGLALIALGAFFLLRQLVPEGLLDGRYVWPVVLIVLGGALLLRGTRR